MDFTSNSHPTRFISMAATSLDNSLQTGLSSNTSAHHHTISNIPPQQIRPRKQYISQNSMINFERNMNNLGNEFEKVRRELTFSTNSLQSQLAAINRHKYEPEPSALSPNHSTSQSLQNDQITPMLPNITATPLPNTSMPLPSSPHKQISTIGSVIDERLQNLRAKLHKLEQEDQLNLEHNIKLQQQQITQHPIKQNYPNLQQNQNMVNKTWEAPIKATAGGSLNTLITPTGNSAVSLPNIIKDPLNTSFAIKYETYMQKYHGRRHESKHKDFGGYKRDMSSHSFPEYTTIELEKSRNETQNMVAKIQEKSKALFATNVTSLNNQIQKPVNKLENDVNKENVLMMDEHDKKLYDKCINNFDDQLNVTWNKTQRELKKLKNMSDHFKRTTQFNENKYNFNEIKSNPKPKPKPIAVDESIASSHWTLDSQASQSLHVPTLKMVHEEHEQSLGDSMEFHLESLRDRDDATESFFTSNTPQGGNKGVQTESFDGGVIEKYNDDTNTNTTNNAEEAPENVINLSFNRGIQVKIPILCKHCNKAMDMNEVKVITLENEKRSNEMEHKQTEFEDEEKRQCITYDDGQRRGNKKKMNVSRDVLYHHQICSTSTATLSRSSSASFIKNNDKTEVGTTMSEYDRKQLIMDLKSMDGDQDYSDCRSDGYLLGQRKRNIDKNRFAKNILNDDRNKSKSSISRDSKKYDFDKRSKKGRSSLREKLQDLKMNFDASTNCNRNQGRNGLDYRGNNDEYSYLKQKLRSYEDKLRNIDPTLLE